MAGSWAVDPEYFPNWVESSIAGTIYVKTVQYKGHDLPILLEMIDGTQDELFHSFAVYRNRVPFNILRDYLVEHHKIGPAAATNLLGDMFDRAARARMSRVSPADPDEYLGAIPEGKSRQVIHTSHKDEITSQLALAGVFDYHVSRRDDCGWNVVCDLLPQQVDQLLRDGSAFTIEQYHP